MNILIYDEKQSLGHLVNSTLRAAGHRTSMSPDPRDAVLKLDTGLFDLVVVGPAGARREVAEFLEDELPHVPILLAGMARNGSDTERVQILTSPLELSALVSTVRRVESRIEQAMSDLAATVSFGEGVMPVIANRVTKAGMILEQDNPAYDFHAFFAASGGRPLIASIEEVELQARVKYMERSPTEEVRSVGVTFEELAEGLWEKLTHEIKRKKEKAVATKRRPRR